MSIVHAVWEQVLMLQPHVQPMLDALLQAVQVHGQVTSALGAGPTAEVQAFSMARNEAARLTGRVLVAAGKGTASVTVSAARKARRRLKDKLAKARFRQGRPTAAV
jgi:hypothetical protein